jgi:hypothetical protein
MFGSLTVVPLCLRGGRRPAKFFQTPRLEGEPRRGKLSSVDVKAVKQAVEDRRQNDGYGDYKNQPGIEGVKACENFASV